MRNIATTPQKKVFSLPVRGYNAPTMPRNIPVHKIRRVLIVRPDAIGDMVLTLPVIAALRRAHPHLHITLLGSRYTYDLVAPTGLFDEILIDKCRTGEARGWRGFWRYVMEIRRMKFDAVVHFYSETPEVWLTVFAGIRYQVGDKAKLGLWPIFRKYGRFLKTFDQTKHVVEYNFQLMQSFGLTLDPETPLVSALTADQKSAGQEKLKEAGWNGQQSIIGFHLGVGGGNKAISVLKFINTIKTLHSEGHAICFTGHSDKEKADRDTLLSQIDFPVLDLVGKTSLGELAGVLSCWNLYIGVDTGPFHLAASMGVPQVAIFPTRRVKPTRWGPWRNRHELVREAYQCPHFCPHHSCPLTVCSDALQEADIIAKAKKVLAGGGYKTANEQFALWFRNSMAVLILSNKETLETANTLQTQLIAVGVRAKITDIHAPDLEAQCLAQDTTIIHNLTGKSRFKLMLLSQRMALKLFNPPLVVNDNLVLSSAENRKKVQRASPFGSQLRLRLSMDQGPPVQAGSVLESQLCGEHAATNQNSPQKKTLLGVAENNPIAYYRHLFEEKKL